eukprot:1151639-Pelagomonas_calceolata.AAC.4
MEWPWLVFSASHFPCTPRHLSRISRVDAWRIVHSSQDWGDKQCVRTTRRRPACSSLGKHEGKNIIMEGKSVLGGVEYLKICSLRARQSALPMSMDAGHAPGGPLMAAFKTILHLTFKKAASKNNENSSEDRNAQGRNT